MGFKLKDAVSAEASTVESEDKSSPDLVLEMPVDVRSFSLALALLASIGARNPPPVFRFLKRRNKINIVAGRLMFRTGLR